MPYPCNPHDVVIFLQKFQLFWIKYKNIMVGLCSHKSNLQYSVVYLPPPLHYRLRLLRLESCAKTPFPQIITYIDLIKTFLT